MSNTLSRIPRKLLLVIVGITVLGGGSGAAAVYVGAEKLLGLPAGDRDGLTCTTLQTVRIKKAGRFWVRKYVVTDELAGGLARMRTALRVAGEVQRNEGADLVQVTVLDKAGPVERAQMRGRAIGAQAVYMPDLSKAPRGMLVQPISAYYIDGIADTSGKFWGMRIDLPYEDAQRITDEIGLGSGCVEPNGGAQLAHGTKDANDQDVKREESFEAAGNTNSHGPVLAAGARTFSSIVAKVEAMMFSSPAEETPIDRTR